MNLSQFTKKITKMKKLIYPIILVVAMVLALEMINPLMMPYLGMGILTAVLLKS